MDERVLGHTVPTKGNQVVPRMQVPGTQNFPPTQPAQPVDAIQGTHVPAVADVVVVLVPEYGSPFFVGRLFHSRFSFYPR